MKKITLTVLMAWGGLALPAQDQATPLPYAEAVCRHIEVLASDEYQGRKPGTAGEEKTIRYIEEQFRQIGLAPGNGDSYLQRIDLAVFSATAPESIPLDGPRGSAGWQHQRDFLLSSRQTAATIDIDGRFVFAGFGIDAPELGWSDYEGVDVSGKIVVVLSGSPDEYTPDSTRWQGDPAANVYGQSFYKRNEAARRGARGVFVIYRQPSHSFWTWESLGNTYGKADIFLKNPPPEVRLDFGGLITKEAAAELFRLAGRDDYDFQKEALKPGFRAIDLAVATHFSFPNTWQDLPTHNVVGLLPGAGRPDEVILFTAHWDHVGMGAISEDGQDVIFNGAVDNEHAFNIILINDGTGKFTDETTLRLPLNRRDSEDIAIADFDSDGDPDLLFVSEDDQVNEYYENDGKGFFKDISYKLPVTGTSNAVAVADLNGDGAPDLLIGNGPDREGRGGQNVCLINDGKGNWTDETAQRLPASNKTTQDLELADVDGDGDLDLIVGNEDDNELLINNGKGFFKDETAARLPLDPGKWETREADFGDVDGDGDPDLFLANVNFRQNKDSQNRLLLNDGGGFFKDETAARLPPEKMHTVDGDLVDLDGDGDLDLLTSNGFGNSYNAYLNDGNGFFTNETAKIIPASVRGDGIDMEMADFNGDGRPDLYFCNFLGNDFLLLGKAPTAITREKMNIRPKSE